MFITYKKYITSTYNHQSPAGSQFDVDTRLKVQLRFVFGMKRKKRRETGGGLTSGPEGERRSVIQLLLPDCACPTSCWWECLEPTGVLIETLKMSAWGGRGERSLDAQEKV